MRHSLGKNTSVAMLAAAVFSLSVVPVLAQSLGNAQYCRNVGGRVVCSPATVSSGARPYEQWDNGAPARASGSSTVPRSYDSAHGFPQSFGAYSAIRGFGQ